MQIPRSHGLGISHSGAKSSARLHHALCTCHRGRVALRAREWQGVYLVAAIMDLDYGDYRTALQRLDTSRDQFQLQFDPLHRDGGVLSHQSAAHLWGAVDLPWGIHITVPRRRRLKGITTHTARLEPSQITIREGLPITTIEQTTIDLGSWPRDDEHRSRWAEHCLGEGLLTHEQLVELLGDTADRTLCWLD
ncbi:hypothetical protein SAMN05445756_2125 [Kytococcus aerolatus]|uniref:Transcriptional regulator, AbiEi antitoxin, Type IV TA system n=2 Tax=Kytococcus aerolatus TaxID=592308 RepID=A0A212U6P1_9MICO|nr:hypothetical protein SAMN05445756_2125 [Kytococcus aerolatus]